MHMQHGYLVTGKETGDIGTGYQAAGLGREYKHFKRCVILSIMSESNITHLSLSEEISSARSSIDHTLLLLRTQLSTLGSKLQTTSISLQEAGESANLKALGCIQEQGLVIDNLINRLYQQKMYLEQAYAYVKLVQKSL